MNDKFAPPPIPRDIKKVDDDHLQIVWQDGHLSVYPLLFLRRECPCAGCCEERATQATQARNVLRVVSSNAPLKYVPTDIQLVGRYAVNIHWNDQHTTGIYTFKLLRKLCPCKECKPDGAAPITHNEFGQVPEDE